MNIAMFHRVDAATEEEDHPQEPKIGHDHKPWPHTTDAKLWADEFCKRNRAADHSTMLGWFANAIEYAKDHGRELSKGSQ